MQFEWRDYTYIHDSITANASFAEVDGWYYEANSMKNGSWWSSYTARIQSGNGAHFISRYLKPVLSPDVPADLMRTKEEAQARCERYYNLLVISQ